MRFAEVLEVNGERARIAKTSIVLRDTVVKGSTLVQMTYMTRVIREREGRGGGRGGWRKGENTGGRGAE